MAFQDLIISARTTVQPTSTFLEKRPGLQRAGSNTSGLLVAAITTTLMSDSNPSSSVSNYRRRNSLKIQVNIYIHKEFIIKI